MMMLAEPISGAQAAALGIATHVVSSGEFQKATTDLALKLSTGPTRAYAAITGLMKAWLPGVAADLYCPIFQLTYTKAKMPPIWKRLSGRVEEAVAKLEIAQEKKCALRQSIGGLNRVHRGDTMDAILKDIGAALGVDESQAP
jgi:hypothetical protein